MIQLASCKNVEQEVAICNIHLIESYVDYFLLLVSSGVVLRKGTGGHRSGPPLLPPNDIFGECNWASGMKI